MLTSLALLVLGALGPKLRPKPDFNSVYVVYINSLNTFLVDVNRAKLSTSSDLNIGFGTLMGDKKL